MAADWKSLSDIQEIQHAYPEDLEFLVALLRADSPYIKEIVRTGSIVEEEEM